jgi:dolichyl-phosphate beta-glucosyltransferase
MDWTKPYLSVVIPAYNEASNFQRGVLGEVKDYLALQKYSWEVVLVDDGSTDETRMLLEKFCKKTAHFRLLSITHGGKSAAVTAGVLSAKGQIVLFTDFDQSTPISQVGKFLLAHERGADVVIGRRSQTQNDTLVRQIRSQIFVTLVQIVALPGILDTQCGFKSFKRNAAQRIFSHLVVSASRGKVTGGYMGAFDVEVLFLARKYGFTIAQLPVEWIKFVSDRLNIWKEPLMMVRDTCKVRLYDILGKYHES